MAGKTSASKPKRIALLEDHLERIRKMDSQ